MAAKRRRRNRPFDPLRTPVQGVFNLTIEIGGNQGITRIWALPRRLLAVVHNQSNEYQRLECTVVAKQIPLDLTMEGDLQTRHLQLEPALDSRLIYLAGDSTVVDQPTRPWACWGQILPVFFSKGVAINNHAWHGKSAGAFIRDGRMSKILSTIRPGDYLLAQFGYNDQHPGSSHAPAFTKYMDAMRIIVHETRKAKAIPILVTPMHRCRFAGGRIDSTLGEYPEAVRDLASRENVVVIDLERRSLSFLETIEKRIRRYFYVNASAGKWPDYPDGIVSKSHHSEYGAFELAKMAACEISEKIPDLSQFIRFVPPHNTKPSVIDDFQVRWW
jgi:lysophospholipase L1-like esterase